MITIPKLRGQKWTLVFLFSQKFRFSLLWMPKLLARATCYIFFFCNDMISIMNPLSFNDYIFNCLFLISIYV